MKSEIILALDVDSLTKAKYFVNELYPEIKTFKVGLRLFTATGAKVIKMIHKKGGKVFLDLKFFDIPNTVAGAVRQAVRQRVAMLTLHISGGQVMLKAAVAAAKNEAKKLKQKRPLLIGVTVLTSKAVNPGNVLALAKAGIKSGLDGVVCSAQEAKHLRNKIRGRFVIVTPGIRAKGTVKDDQKRTATVSEAIQAGSDFLVLGRPILEAKDPLRAVESLKSDAPKKGD